MGNTQHATHVTNAEDDGEFIYRVCVSHAPPVVDLSHALAQRVKTYPPLATLMAFMARKFQLLAMLFRVGMVSLVALLFLPPSSIRDLLSAVMPLFTLSVLTTVLLLSTDILTVLVHNFEFWFLTTINTLNWIVVAVILNDIRALGCFAAWFGYQSVVMLDANHRTYATTLSSSIASAPVLIGIAVVVATQHIQNGNFFAIYVGDRKMADASDLVTFTTSTLVLFFVKLTVDKKARRKRVANGLTNIPCAMLKARLRLVPIADVSVTHPIGEDQPQIHSVRMQQLHTPSLPIGRVDARRTLLPYRYWRVCPNWLAHHARVIRAGFYSIGLVAYASLTFATLHRLHASWIRSNAIAPVADNELVGPDLVRYLGPTHVLVVIVSSASTACFCGGFFLFYQRDLLRKVLWSFDFVFSVSQPIVFHLCLCDANYWELDIVVLAIQWEIWFFWALTLDALTPYVKDCVFGFQKRFAAPVLASIIVATAAAGILLLFIPNLGFRDRVIWKYELSNGVVFSVQSQAVLLGRSFTIVLWCSRHAYLLFHRRDDELTVIRARIEYATPFPLISSTLRQTTRRVTALPLLPSPATEVSHSKEGPQQATTD